MCCKTKWQQPIHTISTGINQLVFSNHDDTITPNKQLSYVSMIELGATAVKYLTFE